MKVDAKAVLVCNCEKTMQIDEKRLATALGIDTGKVHTHLCRTEISAFSDALSADEPVLVCCTQEAPLFAELAEEAGKGDLISFTNIREMAGWSEAGVAALPKMAALIAEAGVDVTPARQTTLASDGTCLVYGEGEAAFDIAKRLSAYLSVSLLLSDDASISAPSVVDMPIYRGRIARAAGHFGAFEVVVNGYAPAVPSSRQGLEFIMPRDGAASRCSIIFDVSSGPGLFSQGERLDGYFKVDPADRAQVAEAILEASTLEGEFEKPLYVSYDPAICAHSRNRKTGCTRCLDVCPVSAISPDGADHVVYDAAICGGCGGCASVCPTGAASYTLPTRQDMVSRLQVLLKTYEKAGGLNPVILVHDTDHGREMIDMMARYGRGLPAHVLPFAVNQTTQTGHDFMIAALALGAQSVFLLIDPKRRDEISGLVAQAEMSTTMISALGYEEAERRIVVLDETDPEAVEGVLWQSSGLAGFTSHDFISSNDKRQIARTALWLLNADAPRPQESIELEAGAPYGQISVDTEGCTLCLACVSACPMGAIRDNEDKPQIRFVEQDCVQCGLCARTCPESVITLSPRFNLSNDAMSPITLNEDEPALCISCGTPFGSKGSIDAILSKLAGKHSMFQSEQAQNLIRMCDDCRIKTQAQDADGPFAAAPRPAVRTTEDYLSEEEAVASGGKRTGLTSDDDEA